MRTFNSPHKNKIRSDWAKPLLAFLNRRLGQKLIYLGLPGTQAEDIDAWIEHLRQVIAFQCDDDKYPDAFEQLFEKLSAYERTDKLDDFRVFRGYIEEVVLRGYDNSSERQPFEQTETITVYNLDFCNQVDKAIPYFDDDNELRKAYKFQAVSKLLEFQKNLRVQGVSKKMVIFLTVHCSFIKGQEIASFLSHQDVVQYSRSINILDGEQKNARLVRYFVVDTLSAFFKTFGFVPHFLPTLFYRGLRNTPMLHFTIMATDLKHPLPATPWLQSVQSLISDRFLTIENGSFANLIEPNLAETAIASAHPTDFFSQTGSFNKYWNTAA